MKPPPTRPEIEAAASQIQPRHPHPIIYLTAAQCEVFQRADRIRVNGEDYQFFANLSVLVRADAVAWIREQGKVNNQQVKE